MNQPTQGGNVPAFPAPGTASHSQGLTKREEFAKAAMQGVMANPNCTVNSFAQNARASVSMADALLAELAK